MSRSDIPVLSIVTVVKNDSEGLSRTIQSIFSQSFTDWELIIKDGNSTDDTLVVARAAARKDSRVFVTEGADDGIYSAMNIAIEMARGRYIIMLNAGDSFRADQLAPAMKLLESDILCQIGLFNAFVQLEGGASYIRRAREANYIRYGQPALHQATIFDAQYHRRHLYDSSYPNIADYVSLARQIRDGAVAKRFDLTLVNFEIRQSSSSFMNQPAVRKEFDNAIVEIWGPSNVQLLYYRLRRALSMLAVRFFMKL